MYGVGAALPAVYTDRFRTQLYNERVVHPGAWNKLVVVAREDDEEAILNHALTWRSISRSTADVVMRRSPVARSRWPRRRWRASGRASALRR
jgi:hypothetical protein